jgi:heme exporter protein A
MMLDVTDLAVARGGMVILSGVTFGVRPGEALVLRGPNGIGKTTLLRTLAGLQPAVSGSVRTAGDGAAYAGHADALKSTLTVAENLRFWAAVFGTGGIGDALAALDLAALRDRPAGNLSAGQKRRLGLARLLVTGRALWLLDEPTVSLDDASVGLFGAVIRAHLGRGGAAVVATHVDLGLDGTRVLDLRPFRAPPGLRTGAPGHFDEAFA